MELHPAKYAAAHSVSGASTAAPNLKVCFGYQSMGFVLNHYFWVWFWLESLVLGFGLNHWFWVLVWITRGFGLNHWFWVYWWRMVTKFWVCVLMPMSMSMPLFCSWSVVSGLWTVVLGSWILLMVSRRWSIVVGFHSSFFFFFFFHWAKCSSFFFFF